MFASEKESGSITLCRDNLYRVLGRHEAASDCRLFSRVVRIIQHIPYTLRIGHDEHLRQHRHERARYHMIQASTFNHCKDLFYDLGYIFWVRDFGFCGMYPEFLWLLDC